MTHTINALVDTYIASWNEGDEARRRALVAQAFADDARYLDPLMAGEGTDGITAMIGAARQQFPGHRFELSFGTTPTMTSCASPGNSSATTARSRAGRTSRPSPTTGACVT